MADGRRVLAAGGRLRCLRPSLPNLRSASPRRAAALLLGARAVTLLAAAPFIPLAGAAAIVLAARRPNLRDGGDAGDRCGVVRGGGLFSRRRCSTARRPATTLGEVAPGLTLGVRGRTAGDAVRLDRVVSLDPQFDLFDRLHAGAWGARPDPFLRLLRGGAVRRRRRGFAANLFTLFLFYELLTVSTWPLVTHAGTDRGAAFGAGLSRYSSRHVDRASAAGDRRHMGGRRNSGLRARRHPRRKGGARRHGGAVRTLHFRHRQGGDHAVPSLAAGGDGGADTGKRAFARCRGGQGGGVRGPQGDSLRVRRRRNGRRATGPMAGVARRVHPGGGIAGGVDERQPQGAAGLFDGEVRGSPISSSARRWRARAPSSAAGCTC